jgi:uncharacterized repeat protein (TIGR03809 family)
MTHRVDVAHGRDVVARWCALAEQRLEYLTELFETGRWRRFHSEVAFLENIQEAKTAVETWRGKIPSPFPGRAVAQWRRRAGVRHTIRSIGFRGSRRRSRFDHRYQMFR